MKHDDSSSFFVIDKNELLTSDMTIQYFCHMRLCFRHKQIHSNEQYSLIRETFFEYVTIKKSRDCMVNYLYRLKCIWL